MMPTNTNQNLDTGALRSELENAHKFLASVIGVSQKITQMVDAKAKATGGLGIGISAAKNTAANTTADGKSIQEVIHSEIIPQVQARVTEIKTLLGENVAPAPVVAAPAA